MRFLNTHSLQFEQIPDSELHLEENQYAILSHRWGADEDEVSFEDVRSSTDFSKKRGFHKLKGFCKAAASANCRYGWVDTCCINKANSSELSEAINSMYHWYQGSKICITYLEDVPRKQMMDSNWFDRGWTLQELIGPKAVAFFDHDWNIIGTKNELIADLSRKTRIPEEILSHVAKPSTCSVAQRMSWAAHRMTTRVEDRAYSLMGLFDIYMPMIYGEREKAFLRLQQHIIQKCKDESIFAWDMDFLGDTRTYSGLFAPSPLAYANCNDIIQTQGSRGFSESNGELSICSRISPHSLGMYFAELHCTDRASTESNAFILIADTSTEGESVRVRDAKNLIRGHMKSVHWIWSTERQIRVPVDPIYPPVKYFDGLWLRTLQPPGHNRCKTTILSSRLTSRADHVCYHELDQGIAGIVRIEPQNRLDFSGCFSIRWITFGFDEKSIPVLWLANDDHCKHLQNAFEQAVASGPDSVEHQQFMKTCKSHLKTGERGSTTRWQRMPSESKMIGSSHYEAQPTHLWQGSLVISSDKTHGVYGRIMEELNLEISVQLQPCNSVAVAPSGDNRDGSGLPLNSMKIWVVDIIDTGGKPSWAKRFLARDEYD